MNRRNELPPELQSAYDEGYALALAGGWLDTLPQETSSESEFVRRSLLQQIVAHQIGFIDGLKEIKDRIVLLGQSGKPS